MKAKLHFSKCIMLMIVLMSTLGALAQTSQTLTQNVCPGTESYRVTPGNVGDSFQWSISTGTSGVNWTISTPTAMSTNVVWANPVAPVTYRLSLTEMNGSSCTTVVSVDVTVYPTPTVTITNPAAVCSPATVDLTAAAVTAGSTAGLTFTYWTDAAATASYATPTTAIAGTYYIKGSTVAGCYDIKVVTVTVNPTPMVAITNPAAVCSPATVDLTAAAVTSGSTSGLIFTYWTNAAATASYATPTTAIAGTYYIKGTTAAGCYDIRPVTVTINPLPTPTITGLAATPTLSSTVYTTQAGMNAYSWSVSLGGKITSGGTATDNTATVKWNTAGSQSVSVNYSNANTCTAASPAVYNVTVGDLPTITGPTPICVNTTNNVYFTEPGMTAYTWTVSTGGTITVGAGTSSVTVTWNTAGAQTVTVNYTNGIGFRPLTSTSKDITVNSLPVPTIAGSSLVCVGTIGSVYTTESGMTAYTWSVTGGTITAGVGTDAVTITWNTAGTQTVSVNYTNATGCMAASSKEESVTVVPLPTTSPIWHN